jgi:hypothetical protein
MAYSRISIRLIGLPSAGVHVLSVAAHRSFRRLVKKGKRISSVSVGRSLRAGLISGSGHFNDMASLSFWSRDLTDMDRNGERGLAAPLLPFPLLCGLAATRGLSGQAPLDIGADRFHDDAARAPLGVAFELFAVYQPIERLPRTINAFMAWFGVATIGDSKAMVCGSNICE